MERTTCCPHPVYFGFYRIKPESLSNEMSKKYLNVTITGMTPDTLDDTIHVIDIMRKDAGKVWLGVYEAVIAYSPVSLRHGWKEILSSMVDRLKPAGVMDSVLGFYFDEPLLCGMQKKDYRTLTQFMRERWPSLRVLTIFATNAIAPDVWSSGNDQVLDPETVRFTTDAGYDMYWDVRGDGILPYKRVNAALKERFGRNDFYVWHVPCIMNYGGNNDEEYAIAHTEAMYQFLRQESNPGGMMCYAYTISNHDGKIGNLGLDEMLALPNEPWNKLYNRLKEIGRDIIGTVDSKL